ncbi:MULTISPECIES: metalloregulator ArsR/SmtB family transcription factor [Haloarcula]|uniref:MarR family transcriptional regulator n=1 Tax=Haloarcula pellucida TaxID=1427151 RepID=A0A830GJL1_9EURY|nr:MULTISPECIES: metalloregulator ArsR/SmtB family transcription factor [Halomicroarcula]MBX0348460.1 metalloregulator ArsR/SmtB family transcription factor [Halomicroarcula pellucida]MDS0278284.1 metalloregulator ArsR/SmtB family transcription factor [Halomicroarcula sp. S1AR25-4]GGN93257.1 MarR family transcriptional regulator [Halomicroarcula pellucida]
MDSAELLDLLGNANRRRILRLLAHKPCYVTEISEYIGVSPKAVIDHLQKLEDAGLVESRTDDQRRKYFSIARNLRLEVRVSPYEFGTKSAYPANPGLDISTCRHLSIDVDEEGDGELRDLAHELEHLEQLENELSLAQRWVQGRVTDVRDQFDQRVDDGDGRLYAELVSALSHGPASVRKLARTIEAPPEMVDEALERLADEGVVEQTRDGWQLR